MGFNHQKWWKILVLAAGLLVSAALASQGFSKRTDEVIGIDLGGTHSRVGVYDKGRFGIIADAQGNRFTPSWVAFTDAEPLIGEAAMNQSVLNPERFIFDIKRLIGRRFDDPEVQRDIKLLPYKIVDRDGKPCIQVKVNDGEIKDFSPEEITAMVLQKMKETAELYLRRAIKYAVITVPAYFNHAQREATYRAGAIAGLDVVRIINEPTAAALCHRFYLSEQEMNALVFDLGGGTFDVSILTLNDGVNKVLSTNGNTHLGGEEFDHRVMDYFAKLIKNKHNKDISEDKKALGKLREACERTKRALSSQDEVLVEIKSLFDGIDFSEPLTRAKFEELNMDLFNKTMDTVKKALQNANMKKEDIDEILLVGGSTKIPKVQQLLKDFFDGKELRKVADPDECVALGAAVQGAIHNGLGDEIGEGISPDIVGVSFSLGIETAGGVMTKLIPRDTKFPTKRSQVFSTSQDEQSKVIIKVFKDEGNLTKDCREIGRLELSGIPPAPRGVPEIEVTFEIDDDYILHVTAEDKAAKIKQTITISYDKWNNFDQEDIDLMVKEAEKYEVKKREVRERIGAINKLDMLVDDTRSLEKIVRAEIGWLEDDKSAEKDDHGEKMKEVGDVYSPVISKIIHSRRKKESYSS